MLEQIRMLHRAQPFLPFVIHLADGDDIQVLHPEFLAIAPSERELLVFHKDGSYDIINVMLVTAVKVKNGRGKRVSIR